MAFSIKYFRTQESEERGKNNINAVCSWYKVRPTKCIKVKRIKGKQLYPNIHIKPKPPFLLQLAQNLRQEVLKAQRDVPIAIIIVLLEHIRHALQADAGLHKQVEAHDAVAALVVRAEEQLDEARAEPVAERHQRVVELVQADVARLVHVEAVKQRPPRGQEGPEPAELLEPDGAAAVAVEHADHHAHGVRVEGGPVTVDERGREFSFGELAGTWRRKAQSAVRFAVHLCMTRGRCEFGALTILVDGPE